MNGLLDLAGAAAARTLYGLIYLLAVVAVGSAVIGALVGLDALWEAVRPR